MSIRHYFAGGNTPLGFYSYYDEVLPPDIAQRTVYIKGGPGTGKSTLMKKLGAAWAEQGCEVEFLHCSGDPGSLDGVVCREHGFSVVDGTAPHAQDPKLLGAVDELFDPGRFMDGAAVRPYRERLLELNAAKKACYARAYRYLSMAGTLFSGVVELQAKVLPENAVDYETETLIQKLFSDRPMTEKRGRLRHAFANAVTPLGVMGYFDTLFEGYQVYSIRTENAVGVDSMLKRIAVGALARGISVQAYCSPLFPKQYEHLVLTDLGIAVTSAKGVACTETIDLLQHADQQQWEQTLRTVRQDLQLFDLLIERTVSALRAAKEEHARLEELLTPSMDFEGMQDEFSKMMVLHRLS